MQPPAEPEHGTTGAFEGFSEDFDESLDSTDNLLGIDDMLDMDMDSGSDDGREKSEDLDLFSIDDLQDEEAALDGPDSEEFGSGKELEDIAQDMQLEPDSGEEEEAFEPKVEFDDTDEFAKYGTLEFNVSDMYKTLGIEVESKVETEQELTELSPEVEVEADELDLSGIDEMLDIEEGQLGAQEDEPPYAEPDDASMELDLSDLEDMLDKDEEADENEPSDLSLDLEDAIDDDDEVNAQTEIFNIEDIEDLDMKTGKTKDPKKGKSPEADKMAADEINARTEIFNVDDIDGLDLGSTEKPGVTSDDDLEFQFDLDPDAEKGEKEEAAESLDLSSDSEDLGGLLMNDADLGLDLEEEDGDEVESLSLDLEQELEQNFSDSFSDFSRELTKDSQEADAGEDSDDLLDFDLESEASDVDVDDQTEVLNLDEDLDPDLDLEEPAPQSKKEDSFELSEIDLLASSEDFNAGDEAGKELDLGLDEAAEEASP
ncbi:MAG: hypothetical protein ACLFQY_15560, partial [Desulfococcaceae bacterium]